MTALSFLCRCSCWCRRPSRKAWGRGFSLGQPHARATSTSCSSSTRARRSATVNSFVYASISAVGAIALGLALAIAYIVSRHLLPFGGVLAFLCMAPFVIPGIVLAIGFYAAYAAPPLALGGTA